MPFFWNRPLYLGARLLECIRFSENIRANVSLIVYTVTAEGFARTRANKIFGSLTFQAHLNPSKFRTRTPGCLGTVLPFTGQFSFFLSSSCNSTQYVSFFKARKFLSKVKSLTERDLGRILGLPPLPAVDTAHRERQKTAAEDVT